MIAKEKQELLDLLDQASRWCQHAEARDVDGNPVHCDDDSAAAWDVTGAVYRLFGMTRAGALYTQLDRHIHGKRRAFAWPPRNLELDAMLALQAFNDHVDTTFEMMRAQLETAPVWTAEHRAKLADQIETTGIRSTPAASEDPLET